MNPLRTLLLLPILLYRYAVSPLLGCHCRFEPSCSAYAQEAITRHGAAHGLKLTAKRLLRCHPFARIHGPDPVPETLTH